MAVITLTTDLGYKDFYQAALKGSILSILPNVNIIDITHSISAFNISQAAFVLKNAYHYFPKGTVHLIGIDCVYNENTRYLAVEYKGHFFVGSDNGIFSLIFDESPKEMVEINIIQDLKFLHFPLTDIFAKACCRIAAGNALNSIGIPVTRLKEKTNLSPVIDKDIIRGSVVYIDSFQNVITNISKDLFTRIQGNRKFRLSFKRGETIADLSWHYNDVPEGEKLCLFGISNNLEIAINKGNASGLLGLNLNDIITIEFFS